MKNAQRTWSRIIHHHEWQAFLQRVQHVSLRDAVRFMAVSQPFAGAWLNAVPSHRPFALHTWAMRLLVQRRLGLPLTAVAVEGAVSRHGREFDVLGDLATNDGQAGHQTRHYMVLRELVGRLRGVWGSAVEYEPPDYKDYSDTRPDLAIHTADGLVLGDTKVFDDVGSDQSAVGVRGAHVAMGNVLPRAREVVLGRQERGAPGKAFNPATGQGHVAAVDGQYKRALGHCSGVLVLLFSTFLGFSPDVVELLRRAAEERGNKLRGSEYDDTTWSARSWTSYTAQRISCVLARAVAWELATAMQLTRVRDARDD